MCSIGRAEASNGRTMARIPSQHGRRTKSASLMRIRARRSSPQAVHAKKAIDGKRSRNNRKRIGNAARDERAAERMAVMAGMMRMLERFKERAAQLRAEASEIEVAIQLIEQDQNGHIQATQRRKLNGALNAHAQAWQAAAAAPEQAKRKPPKKFVRGAMTIPVAAKHGLANVPLHLDDIVTQVEPLRGITSTRFSSAQSLHQLVRNREAVNGKGRRAVYALPEHKTRIKKLEAKIPN